MNEVEQHGEQVLTHSKPFHPPKSPHKTKSEEERMDSSVFSPMVLALVLFLGTMDGVGSAGTGRAGMGSVCVCSLLVKCVSWGLGGRKEGERVLVRTGMQSLFGLDTIMFSLRTQPERQINRRSNGTTYGTERNSDKTRTT
jgi:hypothetical protein